MQAEDKNAFAEMLMAGCAVYDRKPMEALAVKLYWNLLSKFSLAEVQTALGRHMETSKFFPKPSELIELIDGGEDEQSMLAWSKVMEAVRNNGHYRVPQFDDTAIGRAISAIGGWRTFCMIEIDQLAFTERRFREAYRIYARRGEMDGKLLDVAALKLLSQ